MVYPALLPLMRTPRLPVVDWTDAPADLNGLVRLAERRNLVSARVPSHFNWPLHLYVFRLFTVAVFNLTRLETFTATEFNKSFWLNGRVSETDFISIIRVMIRLNTQPSQIIWGHYFIWQILFVTSCRPVVKTYAIQPTTHMRGGIAAGSDKRYIYIYII